MKKIIIITILGLCMMSIYIYANGKSPLANKKNFDYYIFAQSLLQEQCVFAVNNSVSEALLTPQECYVIPDNTDIISLHGLWPSNLPEHQPDPAYCTDTPFDFESLSLSTRKKLRKYYGPVTLRLAEHEWKKHGSCNESTQQEYFDALVQYYEKTEKPAQVISAAIGKSLSYDKIVSTYQQAGTGSVELECRESSADKSQYLLQVITLWNTDSTPLTLKRTGKQCDTDKPIKIGTWPTFFEFHAYESNYYKEYPNPTVVGFDIDDTVLASSPGFYYLETIRKLKTTDPEFWKTMNNGLDEFSIPKSIAKKLLSMHDKKQDTIYFITKRGKSETEILTKLLVEIFDLTHMQKPVIFTNLKDKTSFIKEKGIKVYYGDADTDILSARAAGAKPVRIIRNNSSQNKDSHMNGGFGETVILDSDR